MNVILHKLSMFHNFSPPFFFSFFCALSFAQHKNRNWQIKVSHLLKASLQDTKETAQAQPTRTNAIKRKYFLVSFISHFYRLALNFLSIAFFLDIFLYVAGLFTVYSRLVSFTFDFFRLTSSCYSLRFSLSLLLNILRHFFQTIAAAALFFAAVLASQT